MTCAGERDILGLWAGDGGEGAKFWLSVLTEIKNRGTGDVCIVVCDGLKGLSEAVNTVWGPGDHPDLIYRQWVGRDGLGVHLHHHGQDLCKRVTFEVHMQTRPPVVAAGLGPASESSTTGISGECRDEVPGGPRNCSVNLQVEGI